MVKTEWTYMTHEAIIADILGDKSATTREVDMAQRLECLLEMLKELGYADDT